MPPSFGFFGLPSLVAAAVIIPVFVSAYRVAPRRERRWARRIAFGLGVVVALAGLGAAAAAYSARSHLETGANGSQTALDQLRAGNSKDAANRFSLSGFAFERGESDLNAFYAVPGRFLPVVGQHLDAMRKTAAAGAELDRTAAVAAARADWKTLTASNGKVNLDEVRAMQAPVAATADAAEHARKVIAEVRSPGCCPPSPTSSTASTPSSPTSPPRPAPPPRASPSPPPCSAATAPAPTSWPSPPPPRAAAPAGSSAPSAS